MYINVNALFDKICPLVENTTVLEEIVNIDELRQSVVTRLEEIELIDRAANWWEDKVLMELFGMAYRCGLGSFPVDPVQRIRWIAVLCIVMSERENYDCWDLFSPMDFLPDDLFGLFEERYPGQVLGDIKRLRERLEREGWKAVFPE